MQSRRARRPQVVRRSPESQRLKLSLPIKRTRIESFRKLRKTRGMRETELQAKKYALGDSRMTYEQPPRTACAIGYTSPHRHSSRIYDLIFCGRHSDIDAIAYRTWLFRYFWVCNQTLNCTFTLGFGTPNIQNSAYFRNGSRSIFWRSSGRLGFSRGAGSLGP